MINKELVTGLFGYLKANPDTTETEMINVIVSQSDHTTETASQWMQAFEDGLFEAMVLGGNDFVSLRDRVVRNNLNLDKILEIMTVYLQEHKLPYQLEQEIAEAQAKLDKVTKDTPDQETLDHWNMTIVEPVEQELNELTM